MYFRQIDMNYIFENSARPTEEFVVRKIELEHTIKHKEFTQREQRIYELDRKYAQKTDKIPDIGRIVNSVNLPRNSVSKILDKIEDKLYYKYLDM